MATVLGGQDEGSQGISATLCLTRTHSILAAMAVESVGLAETLSAEPRCCHASPAFTCSGSACQWFSMSGSQHASGSACWWLSMPGAQHVSAQHARGSACQGLRDWALPVYHHSTNTNERRPFALLSQTLALSQVHRFPKQARRTLAIL